MTLKYYIHLYALSALSAYHLLQGLIQGNTQITEYAQCQLEGHHGMFKVTLITEYIKVN